MGCKLHLLVLAAPTRALEDVEDDEVQVWGEILVLAAPIRALKDDEVQVGGNVLVLSAPRHRKDSEVQVGGN